MADNQEEKEKKDLTYLEGLLKDFPATDISYGFNEFGQIIIKGIDIKLRLPRDWNSLPFFWDRLFPLLMPPEIKEKEYDVKRQYCG